MKKNKKWGEGSFKYLIPGIIAVILLSGVLLSNKFITKQNLGSIYNIDEAVSDFNNIQIGDSINYEINGYSDWQVIGKNDYNGTIDVVSKTNTEDLTLEYGQSKEYYENKFQETANKYIDNNYAISARTVNQGDLEYFNYDNNFWLNEKDDINIKTAFGTYQYTGAKNYKVYVIPYAEKFFKNDEQKYNIGDTIEYSNNGVDRWIVANIRLSYDGYYSRLIPETPIELVIEGLDDNIYMKANQIIESFNNDGNSYRDYISSFGTSNLQKLIPNFLNQQKERIYFCNGSRYIDGNKITLDMYYENGIFNRNSDTAYTDTNPYTLGYRPVVTLKTKKEEEIIDDKDKKEISNKLQVGDNVKYEAKGYKNWKVLRVDEDNNIVDIISGGIVKDLTLSGKEDWDNYEDIIQREVDQYKNGDKAKKATLAMSSQLKSLIKIDKNILSRYFLLSKNTVRRKETENGEIRHIYNYVSTVRINKELDNALLYHNIEYDNVTDYCFDFGNIEEGYSVNNELCEFGGMDWDGFLPSQGSDYDCIKNSDCNFKKGYTYTAGIRPVITLKLSDTEKLSDKETKEIEASTTKQEKKYIQEQETKNKDYKGPSKVDDSTSSTGNNNEVKSNDNDSTKKDNVTDNSTSNVEKIIYKDKPSTRYQLIIQYIIIALQLGVIIYLLLKKKK